MAGSMMPRAATRSLLSSPSSVLVKNRLSNFPIALVPYHSRASLCWDSSRSKRLCTQIYRHNPWSLQRCGQAPFTISAVRGAANPEKPEKDDPPPPRTLTAIKETLKTSVSALRHENIYTIPNILTFSRLLATPAIGYLIVHNHHLYAFSLFLYAGFSDLLDGWIARRWKLQTVVGSVVDPMADKALMTTLVSCLAINGTLSLPLATLILGRDISLAVAAVYYRYASLPAPKTWGRYWDFSLPSAEVHPTTVSKFNTFLQLVLIGTTMCVSLLHDPSAINSVAGTHLQNVQEMLGGPDGVKTMVQGMSAVVAGTTIWSGLSYAWMKNAVKILGDNEALKRKQGARGRMIIGSCFGTCLALAAWLAWREREKKTEDVEREDARK
ncbi:uncharacterized protein EI97DRAFT_434418 [Westerdykella ornata]|uniref:Uncharacterized protein n=1 Tax=Westerdykella ornata TaxID=318751 RepID=A0A6A6JGD9_WESOR|nr:uncharacterized protein EI97DRAFT_434418 [Westerdykella ornata]KAF2275183.1 hypothetical protein EI97DRAFT_434418 [Westerdykella ornata]